MAESNLIPKKNTYETSQFDLDFIEHVRKLRMEKGWSQADLSLKMGLAKSFVGNVESITQRHKYSTKHIALLARAFGFANISELFDFSTPGKDSLIVTIADKSIKIVEIIK